MRRRVAFACALGLAACAGGARPAPEAAPAAAPAAPAPPLSPERERFERFKAEAPAADPRADFAHRAEVEAERRRNEALARGVPGAGAPEGFEGEPVGGELAQPIAGRSGCFEEEPDLEGQDDWIRHRTLERGDFLAQSPGAQPELSIPGDEVGAIVSIRFACVAKSRLAEPEPGRYEIAVEQVRYLALMSRRLSWWNPAVGDDEWVLRHEQLHFDVAELFAHELTAQASDAPEPIRGLGPDPQAAIADFQARWSEHMREQQESFREIELAYDRETRHGNDHAKQTEWFARVKRGLGAVRAGLAAPPLLTP